MHRPTVLIHFKQGDPFPDYHIVGNVAVFVVDENAPGDRVYKYETPSTIEEINEIIGESEIGSKDDSRHEALSWRILGKKPEVVE